MATAGFGPVMRGSLINPEAPVRASPVPRARVTLVGCSSGESHPATSEAVVQGDHDGRQSGAGEGDQTSTPPLCPPAVAGRGRGSAAHAVVAAPPSRVLSPSNASPCQGGKAVDDTASCGQAEPHTKRAAMPRGPRRKSSVAAEAVT